MEPTINQIDKIINESEIPNTIFFKRTLQKCYLGDSESIFLIGKCLFLRKLYTSAEKWLKLAYELGVEDQNEFLNLCIQKKKEKLFSSPITILKRSDDININSLCLIDD